MEPPSRAEDRAQRAGGAGSRAADARATVEALRRGELARAGEATRGRLIAVAATALITLVLGGAIFAAMVVARANLRSQQARLDEAAERTSHFLEQRFVSYAQITMGITALFRVNGYVDGASFRDYVRSLHLQRNYPGVLGVGYVKRVDDEGLERFVEQARISQPDFRVTPPGPRAEHFVVRMIEPIENNRGLLGFDIASEPRRRAAAVESERTGQAVLTKRVSIAQDASRRSGFLLFQPIFPAGAGPGSTERADAWAGVGLSSSEFFAGIEEAAGARAVVRIVDVSAEDEPLYESAAFRESDAALEATYPIELASERWRVDVRRAPNFSTRLERREAPTILGFGLIGAVLAGLLAWSLLHTRRRAVILAEEMTAALRRSHVELERLATRDALTGAANRRAFDTRLLDEWSRAARHRTPLALIMLDVDHFKAFNDAYGHPVGDECLRRVSDVARSATRRAGEMVARYGGEEFTMILPGTTREEAMHVAEGVREALFDLAIPHERHPEGRVTASFGVAAIDLATMHDVKDLLRATDEALYRAKNAGRNRVEHR